MPVTFELPTTVDRLRGASKADLAYELDLYDLLG